MKGHDLAVWASRALDAREPVGRRRTLAAGWSWGGRRGGPRTGPAVVATPARAERGSRGDGLAAAGVGHGRADHGRGPFEGTCSEHRPKR